MRVIGNLSDEVQQRAKTPGEHEARQADDDAKRPRDVFPTITRQPEDGPERAEHNPDNTSDFQRTGPPGLASDFPRAESGVVNAVAEVNDDAKRKPVNQSLPR